MFAQSITSRTRSAVGSVRAPLRAPRSRKYRLQCAGEGRLVGLPAPDFTAEAVYDQEFMEVTLSSYAYASPLFAGRHGMRRTIRQPGSSRW